MKPLSLLTWNILRDGRSPLASGWSRRKESFEKILTASSFDLLCLQEVLPVQLDFFQEILPTHDYYGVGRDDGESQGEHCPIFFRADRFAKIDSGSFWLSPTPEIPSAGWGEAFSRVCSWVDLEDLRTGKQLRVSNLHLQLHPHAQSQAAALLADRLAQVTLPQLVAGDFNCPAHWPGVKKVLASGLARIPGENRATFHLRGLPIRKLDHILTSSEWAVEEVRLLNQRGGRAFPSDHFGLSAQLHLD